MLSVYASFASVFVSNLVLNCPEKSMPPNPTAALTNPARVRWSTARPATETRSLVGCATAEDRLAGFVGASQAAPATVNAANQIDAERSLGLTRAVMAV